MAIFEAIERFHILNNIFNILMFLIFWWQSLEFYPVEIRRYNQGKKRKEPCEIQRRQNKHIIVW